MHKRYHAQRKHIIQSLDSLLYQLHTLSFFLSPAFWALICRLLSQLQCSKSRDLDASLRFLFISILFLNLPTLWNHATITAGEGRAVVLDFIGLSYAPSKLQLFALDVFIIFLQFIFTTIVYETSVAHAETDADTPNALLSDSLATPSEIPLSLDVQGASDSKQFGKTPEYIFDLTLSTIIARLRNSASRPQVASSDAFLPLPNTTPWPLPAGMRMLMRASAQIRQDAAEAEADMIGNRRERRIPGSLVRE